MNMIAWTVIFAITTVVLYLTQPNLGLMSIRKVIGITFFLELFYLLGSYMWDWPFPTPLVLAQLFIVVGLGIGLGGVFSRVWPLPPQKGIERVMRTLLLCIPALGLGIGLQVLMQNNEPTQALYLIFALGAWLGSGATVRTQV